MRTICSCLFAFGLIRRSATVARTAALRCAIADRRRLVSGTAISELVWARIRFSEASSDGASGNLCGPPCVSAAGSLASGPGSVMVACAVGPSTGSADSSDFGKTVGSAPSGCCVDGATMVAPSSVSSWASSLCRSASASGERARAVSSAASPGVTATSPFSGAVGVSVFTLSRRRILMTRARAR